MNRLKTPFKRLLMPYRKVGAPIFLVATPRGGSTWLAELIWSQRGIRFVDEPFNLRRNEVSKALGSTDWAELYATDNHVHFEPYLDAIISGRNRSSDVVALRHWRRIGWRWQTDRALLKIIHAGSDVIPWMCSRFQGRAVLLLRHPLATAVSREVFPFLENVQRSEAFIDLTAEQKVSCVDALHRNSGIEKGVVAWCLFMGPALKNISSDVLVLTYEQLVTDPEPALMALARHLSLPCLADVREALMKPSLSSFLCDDASRAALNSGEHAQRARLLISKWRRHVSPEQERKSMDVLKVFQISAYKAGDLFPAKDFWIDSNANELAAKLD